MKKILKHLIAIKDSQSIIVREGSAILSVGLQRDNVVMYTLSDIDAKDQFFKIKMFNTGKEVVLSPNAVFLKTLTISVFEVVHIFLEK